MAILPFGPPTAKIMLVQDEPTYQDSIKGLPFQGNNGIELDKMLQEIGLMGNSCFYTCFAQDYNSMQPIEKCVASTKKEVGSAHQPFYDKMVLPRFIESSENLEKQIELVKPKVIVVFQNSTLLALTGNWGLRQWRGSILYHKTKSGHTSIVIATYHPSYIRKVWKDRPTVLLDLALAKQISEGDKLPVEPDYDFIISPNYKTVIETLDHLHKLADEAETHLRLSVDLETRNSHIACLGIAWTNLKAICIPFLQVGDNPHYWLDEEETLIVYRLYKLLTHPKVLVIGQNFLYDAQYLLRWFLFAPSNIRDTMIAQHVMFSNRPKDLSFLASLYCEHHVFWKDESKNWNPKLGERQLWIYNCKDAVVTLEVDSGQEASFKLYNNWAKINEVRQFQQDLFHVVLTTMERGIRVNEASKNRLAKELGEAIDNLQQEIDYLIGHEIKVTSPKQMVDLFYRELDQPKILNRETRNPTANEEALTKIAKREPLLKPLVDRMILLRSLGVFKSTFLEAELDVDSRMRCSFNIAGTSTYRFSSSKNAFNSGMNLQNVPSGDESEGLPNIRSLFLPDEGYEFFDIDLDSADLRIVVWESDCSGMKKLFAEGKKPYVEIAKEYYQDPTIDKNHSSYKQFKALCHGTNYLGKPHGIAGLIGLDENEVSRIQDWYFERFPEIRKWQQDTERKARLDRYVENVFGYRLHIFDRIEGTVMNEIIAWKPQSTVANLINHGYYNIHHNCPDIQVLLQVHDSLAGQYPLENREESIQSIINNCLIPLPYSETLTIPVGIKTSPVSWGDCG